MSTYVLDASAVLRFTDKEAGHNRISDLLKRAAKSEVELLISAVNWAEIVVVLNHRAGAPSVAARNLASNLAALPISVVPIDQLTAEAAAIFKVNFKVPLADAFAGSLALGCTKANSRDKVTLVTADFDFKAVPAGTMKIEFLPIK